MHNVGIPDQSHEYNALCNDQENASSDRSNVFKERSPGGEGAWMTVS